MPFKQLLVFLLFLSITLLAKADLDNIATSSRVTASTTKYEKFKPSNVIDGIIGVDGKGEWACEGVTTDWGYVRFPWIQMDWDQPQAINKIILFDRPSLDEHVASGKLVFSDGSVIWV